MVGGADELAHATVLDAQSREKLGRLLLRKFGEFAFDLGADDDGFATQMLGGIFAHGFYMFRRRRVSIQMGKVVFSDIAGEQGWLRCEEEKSAQEFFFVRAEIRRESRFARIQVGNEFFRQGEFGLGCFVSTAGALLVSLRAFLHRSEIGEDKLGIDNLDVAHRIHCA